MPYQNFSIRIIQVILKLVQRHVVRRSYFKPFEEMVEILLHMFGDIHFIDCHAIGYIHPDRRVFVGLRSIVDFGYCIVRFF